MTTDCRIISRVWLVGLWQMASEWLPSAGECCGAAIVPCAFPLGPLNKPPVVGQWEYDGPRGRKGKRKERGGPDRESGGNDEWQAPSLEPSQTTKKMGDIGARWGRSSVRNPGLTACNWLLQRPVPHKPAGRTRSAGAFGVQSDMVDFSSGAPPIARLPAYQRSGPMAGRANQHAGMVTVNQPSLDSARRTSGDLWRHYSVRRFLLPISGLQLLQKHGQTRRGHGSPVADRFSLLTGPLFSPFRPLLLPPVGRPSHHVTGITIPSAAQNHKDAKTQRTAQRQSDSQARATAKPESRSSPNPLALTNTSPGLAPSIIHSLSIHYPSRPQSPEPASVRLPLPQLNPSCPPQCNGSKVAESHRFILCIQFLHNATTSTSIATATR